MANKHLKLTSHSIIEDVLWFYEEPKGLCFVLRLPNGQSFTRVVSWRTIRGMLKRKDQS